MVRKGWKKKFLTSLRKTGSVSKACKAAGVSRYGAYKAAQENAVFAKKWEEARTLSRKYKAEILESVAFIRATKGNKRNVITKEGDVIEVTDKPSDRLLIKLLESLNPEVFGVQQTNSKDSAREDAQAITDYVRAMRNSVEPDGENNEVQREG